MNNVEYPLPNLATLSDVPDGPDAHSLRLAAVVALLPTGTQTRASNALQRAKIHTLAALCRKKRSDLHRSKSVGRKIVDDLQTALARYGLTLAGKPSRQEVKINPKPVRYVLGAGPHEAERIENNDGTVTIRMFDGKIFGHGNNAKDAAQHLSEQLSRIAFLVRAHEGDRS